MSQNPLPDVPQEGQGEEEEANAEQIPLPLPAEEGQQPQPEQEGTPEESQPVGEPHHQPVVDEQVHHVRHSSGQGLGGQGQGFDQYYHYDQNHPYQGYFYHDPDAASVDDQGHPLYPDFDHYRDYYQYLDQYGDRQSDDWAWGDHWGYYDDQGVWHADDFYGHGSFFVHDGDDEDLDEANDEGVDDTMKMSSEGGESDLVEEEEEEEEREFDFKSKRVKKKKSGPVEISKPTLRWYTRKILKDHIPSSEENLRRRRLLEKCQIVRKVSKPVLTLFGRKTKPVVEKIPSDSEKHADDTDKQVPFERESKQSVFDDDDTEQQTRDATLKEYSRKDWALKNTLDFLTKEGCSSSSGKSYSSALKNVRDEGADFRLELYEKQLQRRRGGIGHHEQAPEITDAMRRHAERAVWRAVIDNTKPRYPLPRFILPRHRYLKKVQAQFIGPGSYEHDVYEAQMKLRRMKLPSTWATCTSRFPKDKEESGKNAVEGTVLLDPWTSLDKANYNKKYPGIGVPFESTPENFRKSMVLTGSGVPPNAYNIKSPLEEYIKSKTSLRGPYDCYTPSRSVIPYGYYKTPNENEKIGLGPGSYEIRTSMVKEMHDSYHAFKGVVGKADRSAMFGFKAAFENPLWPKPNPGIPPVGTYDPDTDSIGHDKLQETAPFKVQTGWKKKTKRKPELVAPDYYYFGTGSTWTVPPKGANLASVFKSRSPQTMNQKMHGVRRERNRALNRKFDIESGGYKFEEHWAFDEPMKRAYVLEDCKDPCARQKGPKADPFAIPGHGIVNVPGPNGKILETCCQCK